MESFADDRIEKRDLIMGSKMWIRVKDEEQRRRAGGSADPVRRKESSVSGGTGSEFKGKRGSEGRKDRWCMRARWLDRPTRFLPKQVTKIDRDTLFEKFSKPMWVGDSTEWTVKAVQSRVLVIGGNSNEMRG
ncbi:hypothetical protein AXG93_1130s1570 [Marchantia polymorpha subsp. ruderalis]|uniref:Uncharacterized protein n=1 Tax=Marchantia polymorpha subsp. ruderalis TaxID=1480154 RepID=A0A176VG78_MARPO|nr:hypothetical protein AXG93_1130s1570 [Marchantia polymorpha subsp. ruderalis]